MQVSRVIVFLAMAVVLAFAQAQKPFTNVDVEKMVKAGFDEDTILKAIEANKPGFDTSVEGLVELKDAGVSSKIINAILTKAAQPASSNSLTKAPGQPTQPDQAITRTSTALYKGTLPSGIGIFFRDGEDYFQIPSTNVEGKKTNARYMALGTIPIRESFKLDGSKAKILLSKDNCHILVHLPSQDVSKLQLISVLEKNKNDRLLFEISGRLTRSLKMIQIPTSLNDLGNGYFEINPLSPLDVDDYAIVSFDASGNLPGTSQAKVWDFSIIK
jgi:hypothetical protein